ncbi:hypothetical protein NUW54_g4738 [Trametes sanguinea]|uniref:Uncharacterized protein n=1 Tax=Trametes sanguinea TaxID=158606 RepID=A0ACC1PX26_9APHY|nr:hypothetical protein NUW54_g4738 [Trametes sanguinea]
MRRLTWSAPPPARALSTSISHNSDKPERMDRPMHDERMHHARAAKLHVGVRDRARQNRSQMNMAAKCIHRSNARKATKGKREVSWESMAVLAGQTPSKLKWAAGERTECATWDGGAIEESGAI